MRFNRIQRHIYLIATKGTSSEWFYLNRDNEYTFRQGIFKGRTAEEVYNLFKDQDTVNNYFDYLQFLYDEYDLKTKRAVYEIYHSIKKNERK